MGIGVVAIIQSWVPGDVFCACSGSVATGLANENRQAVPQVHFQETTTAQKLWKIPAGVPGCKTQAAEGAAVKPASATCSWATPVPWGWEQLLGTMPSIQPLPSQHRAAHLLRHPPSQHWPQYCSSGFLSGLPHPCLPLWAPWAEGLYPALSHISINDITSTLGTLYILVTVLLPLQSARAPTMRKPGSPSFPRPLKILCSSLSPLTLPSFIFSSSLPRNRWIIFKHLFYYLQCMICLCFKGTGLSWIGDMVLRTAPGGEHPCLQLPPKHASLFFFFLTPCEHFFPKAVLSSLACWFTLPTWTSQKESYRALQLWPTQEQRSLSSPSV